MNDSQMVVAAKYRLTEFESIQKGTFKQNGAKELIFAKKIVPRSYVNEQNETPNNVKWVIDEDATLEMYKQRELNIVQNAEREQRSKLSMADLVDAVAGSVAKKKESTKTTDEKTEFPSENWSKEDLQKYCDEKGIEYSGRHGVAKLLELITKKD